MDPKYYQSKIVPLRFELGDPIDYRPKASLIEEIQVQLESFRDEDVEEAKRRLGVVRNVYNNNPIPGYADFAQLDNYFDLFEDVEGLPYLSLNNGPGDFDVYLHAKLSNNCSVISMTKDKYQLSKVGLNVHPNDFLVVAGKDGSGDIRSGWPELISARRRVFPYVHFSLCSLPRDNELNFFYHHVILTLSLLNVGYDAVLEMPGGRSPLEYSLVQLCASYFEEISVFKPATSDLFSPRRFLVCRRLLEVPPKLPPVGVEVKDSDLVSELTSQVVDWLDEANDEIDSVRLLQYENCLKILSGESVEVDELNQALLHIYSQVRK